MSSLDTPAQCLKPLQPAPTSNQWRSSTLRVVGEHACAGVLSSAQPNRYKQPPRDDTRLQRSMELSAATAPLRVATAQLSPALVGQPRRGRPPVQQDGLVYEGASSARRCSAT